jgi:threonine dehydrogenase-like Zn-dependent dehydrogenase
MPVRAVVISEPGAIGVREFDMPEPEPGSAILRVHLSGICGTDKHTFRGESLQYAGTDHEHGIDYPLICGHEVVGTLERIGPHTQLRDAGDGSPLGPGDRVVVAANIECGECPPCRAGRPYFMCDRLEDYGNSLTLSRSPGLFGGWAEAMYLLPGTHLFRVPDDVPDEVAVLTEPMAVTHGLDSAAAMTASGGGFEPGCTVVLLGLGPLGLCHLIKARAMGAGHLVAIDRMPTRLNHARRFGAGLCLDAARTTAAERREAVLELTGGQGADVVIDCTGVGDVVAEAIELLRMGGTLIEPGAFVDMGETRINANRHLCMKSILVIGVAGEVLPAYPAALRLMSEERERMPLTEFVTHRLALDDCERAIDLSMSPDAMKVTFDPNAT